LSPPLTASVRLLEADTFAQQPEVEVVRQQAHH